MATTLLRTVVLAAALTTLAGCSRGPAPTASQAVDTESTLVRALGGEPETLDPRLAVDNPSLELMLDLFEGLTTEAADGSIVPGSAQSWTVSDDGLVWTFQLKPGLRWSDGTPLDARDFARGIEEATAQGTLAPNAELLAGIRRARAQEDGTLVVSLTRPVPYLPALLALPVAAPEPAVSASASGLPISNGPYRLAGRRTGQDLLLERNPHYHSTAKLAIERVRYLTTDNLDTELNFYRTGELDVTSEVPNASIGWIRDNFGQELHVTPILGTYAYVVNGTRVARHATREALALAIDRNILVEKVTGAGEQAALGWVPPGLAGYAPVRFEWARLSPEARVERSRESWRADVRGSRAKLKLCTDASANHHRTAVALASQWHEALGVDVEIAEMEWKAYLAMRQRPNDCDLVRFGWSADFMDAEAFLALFETNHPQNVGRYSSPEYDDLMAKSRLASNAAERVRLLQQAESVLLRDVPVIPVFHRVSKRLIKPSVRGVAANPLGHLPTRYLAWQD